MENILKEFKILEDNLKNLQSENISSYNLDKTAVFIVDINNGFAKSGNLSSDRVKSLIEPIYNFVKPLEDKFKSIIAFTDTHDEDSVEFLSYPTHCLRDDYESKVVDELLDIKNLKILPKNSTNGFFAMDIEILKDIDNIIIVGDCTDICIYQFAVTLKGYFNQENISKNVIVPVNLVDTYDAPGLHPANIMNTVFLNSMAQNGIKLVKEFL